MNSSKDIVWRKIGEVVVGFDILSTLPNNYFSNLSPNNVF